MMHCKAAVERAATLGLPPVGSIDLERLMDCAKAARAKAEAARETIQFDEADALLASIRAHIDADLPTNVQGGAFGRIVKDAEDDAAWLRKRVRGSQAAVDAAARVHRLKLWWGNHTRA